MDKIAAGNLSCLAAVLLFLLALPARALEPAGSSFDTLLERLSAETGYAFEVLGEKPGDDVRITSTDDSSLTVKDRLRRILYKAGVTGYILQEDEAGKVMQVVITEIGRPGEPYRTASGAPGELTLGELERIKKEHREKTSNLPDDAVIEPSSEYGPALTLGQIKAAKEEYRAMLELETDETVLMPQSEYGNALTKGDLEEVKEMHRLQTDSQSSVAEVDPAVETDGPALTVEDLRIAREHHTAAMRQQSDDTVILPASEYGPPLTLGELSAVKAEYRARIEEQTQDTQLQVIPEESSGASGL